MMGVRYGRTRDNSTLCGGVYWAYMPTLTEASREILGLEESVAMLSLNSGEGK